MANDPPEEVRRWTAKRRVALVVSILKGETSVQQAARKHGLTVAEVEDWQERFLLARRTACGRARRKRRRSPIEQVTCSACDHTHAQGAQARLSWARLLKRVFDIDIEHCPNCGALKIIALIEDPPVSKYSPAGPRAPHPAASRRV